MPCFPVFYVGHGGPTLLLQRTVRKGAFAIKGEFALSFNPILGNWLIDGTWHALAVLSVSVLSGGEGATRRSSEWSRRVRFTPSDLAGHNGGPHMATLSSKVTGTYLFR